MLDLIARLTSRRRNPLVLLTLSLFAAGCGGPPPSEPKYNLVLICIDTVRADNFFSERIDDALSARLDSAQQYRNAHSVSSWTIPAVASTLTGFYPIQHQAGQFPKQPANLQSDLPSALDDSATTLTEILADNGVRTRGFSAHPWFSAKFGLEQGFSKIKYYKGWQKVTGKFTEWLGSKKEDGPGDRFFAYLHFMEAHDWHLRNKKELEDRLAEVNPSLLTQLSEDSTAAACTDSDSRYCKRNMVYNLAVRELRAAVDVVLTALESRGLLQDTIVMVYSDHGEEFYEHKAEHMERAAGGSRKIFGFGHGHSMYQEVLQVPLVVWHPEHAGVVRHDMVSLVDVMPSALAWLGIQYDGASMPGKPLPLGNETPHDEAEPRILHASGIAYGPEAISVREGFNKSIMYFPDQKFEYFDLAADPDEKHPIQSDSMTMRFDVLTGDYLEMKQDVLLAAPELSAKTLEHLKSIGYLQGVEVYTPAETDQEESPDAEYDLNSPDQEESPDS